jgi:acetylornithine deacetylase/succinyl-diaminopimelate desuccinylase-like protein
MNYMKKPSLLFLISLLIYQAVSAQTPEVLNIRKFSQLNAGKIISEYSEFLALPNVAADPVNLKKNAAFIMKMMTNRGIKNVQLLEASTPGVPAAVYGEVIVPNATQTIVFYAHYDGQPVDPTQWAKGLEAFKPVSSATLPLLIDS